MVATENLGSYSRGRLPANGKFSVPIGKGTENLRKRPCFLQNGNGKMNGKFHGAVAPCDCPLHIRSPVAQIAQCFLVARAPGRSWICTGLRAHAFPRSLAGPGRREAWEISALDDRTWSGASHGALAPRISSTTLRPGPRESMGELGTRRSGME